MASPQPPPRYLKLFSERVVLSVIGLNIVALFAHGFAGIRSSGLGQALAVFDYICLVYFVIEIVAKVNWSGWERFWSRGMNRFDFLVVALSTPALVAPFMDWSDLSAIVALRGFRMVRLLRVLRFIPHSERLWLGVVRAMKAAVGLLLVIVGYNLVLGLMASHLLGTIDPVNFGDPLVSVYSIFKVFTIENWHDIPDKIAQSQPWVVGWLVRTFFVVAVVTGGLLGLGLTNAVLVDEMVMDNTEGLERDLILLTNELKRTQASQADQLVALNEKLDRVLARLSPPPDDST